MATRQNLNKKPAPKKKTQSELKFEVVNIDSIFPTLDAISWLDLPSLKSISQFAGIDPRTAGTLFLTHCKAHKADNTKRILECIFLLLWKSAVSSSKSICKEILGLTKMNWNNTQFDNKYPITIGCARRVVEIMKYLDENEYPKESYAFYM